jgi:hypothetical protein
VSSRIAESDFDGRELHFNGTCVGWACPTCGVLVPKVRDLTPIETSPQQTHIDWHEENDRG